MRGFIKILAPLALILGLSGCETMDDLNPFSSDNSDPRYGASDQIVRPKAEVPKEFVVEITNLELGRLFRGYMLTAEGLAPGIGYYEPELRPRNDGELAPDGFLEFNFVAAAPEEVTGTDAPEDLRRLRGDVELTPDMLRSARGVRVWAANASVEGRF